jgi:Zn-dependent protease with chaperone function/tetratricopeptide (TPR) repeat protein
MEDEGHMEAANITEKPLNRGAKAALMLGAAATILLFYTLSVVVILFLSVFLLCLLGVFLVALRFGLAGTILPALGRYTELLKLFLQSFWLRKGVEFRLPLKEPDAPELFAVLRQLADKLQIAPPQVVELELGLTAWVQLKGLRQGKGQTILGVGYDLLAGLSKAEMEGVLAHEMTHAKLIQRGFKGWLTAGLSRLAKLTNQLYAFVDDCKRAGHKEDAVEGLCKGADWLTRLAVRQISAYSRQDEFEADQGAAELCGAIKIRSSLMKLESLEEVTSQLPWKERVAQLQLEGGYSRWLRQELAKADTLPRKKSAEVFNQYSTHPTLKDRLAALPEDGSTLPSNPAPAIDLLADPDEVADKLVVEIQKKQAEVEAADSKELKKWTRKTQGGGDIRPVQFVGIVLFIIGIVLLFRWMLVVQSGLPDLLMVALTMAGGVLIYRLSRYKDKARLPVPEYAAFMQSWRQLSDLKDVEATLERVEATLLLRLKDQESNRKKRARFLAEESFKALASGDYLGAHVAARLCLEQNSVSVEGLLGYGIAASALNLTDQAGWALGRLKQLTGLQSTETAWGTAWTLLMLGDWTHAEAFLHQALAERPLEASWRILLALAQARRGKLQNAIKNAREACALVPQDEEAAKLFINLLLEGGYFREAQERLMAFGDRVETDTDLIFAQVRVLLIQQKLDLANDWAERLKQQAANAQIIVQLGETYEEARQHDHAVGCYNRALEAGYYPEAFVGLGRVESHRQNHLVAQAHFLSALELNRPLGEKATGPLNVFHEVVERLASLQDPSLNCRAWVVSLTGSATPAGLANQSFLVYAAEQKQAEKHFETILGAMRKGLPPFLPGTVNWSEAVQQLQPDGPVRPGVQRALA